MGFGSKVDRREWYHPAEESCSHPFCCFKDYHAVYVPGFISTHFPLLSDSFHLRHCHKRSVTFSFLPPPFLCCLLCNLPLFLTVSALILSWSHFPHHATIQSSPCFTLFSTSLLLLGSGVVACCTVTQGQTENELVKYDRQFESFLFQEYIYMLMYCSLISFISQSKQVSFWCCY